MGKKAVHFGAGNIGRGFVGCFLHESGYDVVFADVADKTVNDLNTIPSYKVIEVDAGGKIEEKVISNYRAINSKYNEAELIDEIATADVVTCSVGPNILPRIAPAIAKGIDKRSDDLKPVAVIACENMIGATSALAEDIAKYDKDNLPKERQEKHHLRAAYANSAIDRIVPDQKATNLDVELEKFYEWIVEEKPFETSSDVKTSSKVERPSIKGIQWTPNLEPFIERKLYTVNTAHATAAYYGYNLGKTTIFDAMKEFSDAECTIINPIRGKVDDAIKETGRLIEEKHGFTAKDQKEYREKIVKRISNPLLEDPCVRVGRAPLRKLGRKERFIGPAAEIEERGGSTKALLGAVEMAFRFQNVEVGEVEGKMVMDEESKELATIMQDNSPEDVVTKVTGLSASDKLYPKVVEIVKKVQADSRE